MNTTDNLLEGGGGKIDGPSKGAIDFSGFKQNKRMCWGGCAGWFFWLSIGLIVALIIMIIMIPVGFYVIGPQMAQNSVSESSLTGRDIKISGWNFQEGRVYDLMTGCNDKKSYPFETHPHCYDSTGEILEGGELTFLIQITYKMLVLMVTTPYMYTDPSGLINMVLGLFSGGFGKGLPMLHIGDTACKLIESISALNPQQGDGRKRSIADGFSIWNMLANYMSHPEYFHQSRDLNGGLHLTPWSEFRVWKGIKMAEPAELMYEFTFRNFIGYSYTMISLLSCEAVIGMLGDSLGDSSILNSLAGLKKAISVEMVPVLIDSFFPNTADLLMGEPGGVLSKVAWQSCDYFNPTSLTLSQDIVMGNLPDFVTGRILPSFMTMSFYEMDKNTNVGAYHEFATMAIPEMDIRNRENGDIVVQDVPCVMAITDRMVFFSANINLLPLKPILTGSTEWKQDGELATELELMGSKFVYNTKLETIATVTDAHFLAGPFSKPDSYSGVSLDRPWELVMCLVTDMLNEMLLPLMPVVSRLMPLAAKCVLCYTNSLAFTGISVGGFEIPAWIEPSQIDQEYCLSSLKEGGDCKQFFDSLNPKTPTKTKKSRNLLFNKLKNLFFDVPATLYPDFNAGVPHHARKRAVEANICQATSDKQCSYLDALDLAQEGKKRMIIEFPDLHDYLYEKLTKTHPDLEDYLKYFVRYKEALFPFKNSANYRKARCADGGLYRMAVKMGTKLNNEGDFFETNILYYFQGGGANWNNYLTDLLPILMAGASTGKVDNEIDLVGIFDEDNFDRDDNPYKDFTYIQVTYCQADLFLGLEKGLEAGGLVNSLITAVWLKLQTLDDKPLVIRKMVITGCSAGSVGAQAWSNFLKEFFARTEKDTYLIAESYVGVMPPIEPKKRVNEFYHEFSSVWGDIDTQMQKSGRSFSHIQKLTPKTGTKSFVSDYQDAGKYGYCLLDLGFQNPLEYKTTCAIDWSEDMSTYSDVYEEPEIDQIDNPIGIVLRRDWNVCLQRKRKDGTYTVGQINDSWELLFDKLDLDIKLCRQDKLDCLPLLKQVIEKAGFPIIWINSKADAIQRIFPALISAGRGGQRDSGIVKRNAVPSAEYHHQHIFQYYSDDDTCKENACCPTTRSPIYQHVVQSGEVDESTYGKWASYYTDADKFNSWVSSIYCTQLKNKYIFAENTKCEDISLTMDKKFKGYSSVPGALLRYLASLYPQGLGMEFSGLQITVSTDNLVRTFAANLYPFFLGKHREIYEYSGNSQLFNFDSLVNVLVAETPNLLFADAIKDIIGMKIPLSSFLGMFLKVVDDPVQITPAHFNKIGHKLLKGLSDFMLSKDPATDPMGNKWYFDQVLAHIGSINTTSVPVKKYFFTNTHTHCWLCTPYFWDSHNWSGTLIGGGGPTKGSDGKTVKDFVQKVVKALLEEDSSEALKKVDNYCDPSGLSCDIPEPEPEP